MQGFLGTRAGSWADLNLLVQFTLAVFLLAGMWLARRKYYFAHGLVQTPVLVLNLFLMARVMMTSFVRQVVPQIPSGLSDRYYSVALGHAITGGFAELLGIYVVLVAGTKVLPERLRFRNYKAWMRATLLVWWIATFFGLAFLA